MAEKKSHPNFNVLNAGGKRGRTNVKKRWRKPRGIDNKKRIRKASHGACPRVGYKNPAALRGKHPTGLEEVLVHNLAELEAAAGKLVRIAGSVGKRKRAELEKKAAELKLKIANKKGAEVEKKKAKAPKEKPKGEGAKKVEEPKAEKAKEKTAPPKEKKVTA